MKTFKRFKSNHPCPVCGKKGKCGELENGSAIICYSVRGPESPLLVGGWKWSSFAKNEMGRSSAEAINALHLIQLRPRKSARRRSTICLGMLKKIKLPCRKLLTASAAGMSSISNSQASSHSLMSTASNSATSAV